MHEKSGQSQGDWWDQAHPPNFDRSVNTKAELQQVGIFFRTQFSSLGFFINKKVGNRKN